MTNKHNEIKAKLGEGLSVRLVSRSLGVSTKTVQEVRAQYPDLFAPRPPKKEKPARVVRIPSVPVFARIAANINDRFMAEVFRLGVTRSELVQRIFDGRYGGDNFNPYTVPGECGCENVVLNCNSNRDGDELVCAGCGRVFGGKNDE